MILSPHTHHQDLAGLGPPEGQRPVFVRYDREEAEDVEISLASDSDDSVVIVPPGMLNMETQQDDAAAANSQSMTAAAGGAAVTLAEGEPVTMVTNTAAATPIDGASLPNDLTTSAPLLTTSAPPINSFPPPSASVVSLVPALNSNPLTAPPGGLVEPMPSRPQLQQMLMQPSAAVQQGPLSLPLQIHQLQSQLGQQGRPLQHQPPVASNEDSGVININSTDDEEDDEDMDDDEEEEEEEGVEDEEEEEDEVSDFADEEFYDGEDYEEFDEDAEELEEEDEEEGDIPPLEGAEEQGEPEEVEQGGVLQAAVEAAEIVDFSVEGEAGGGIEEIQTKRALFPEDRMKVQEVESIGVMEEARGEAEEDETERVCDPTMPQILCVTGGALEEKEEEGGRVQEDMSSWERDAKTVEPQGPSGEAAASTAEQVGYCAVVGSGAVNDGKECKS